MRHTRMTVGLSILLAVAASCAAEDSNHHASGEGATVPDRAAVSVAEVQVRRAMKKFLGRCGSELLPRGPQALRGAVTGDVTRGPFTVVDGQTYYFSAPSFVATVRAEDVVVVRFSVKRSSGERQEVLDTRRGKRASRMSRERARGLGERLVRTLLGSEAFKQYREFGEGICSEAEEGFFWAKSDFDAKVRRGIAWFNVCVDPVAGEVASFSRRLQIPEEAPRISAERARRIVEGYLQSRPAELGTRGIVESLTLLPLHYPKRGRVTVWAVRYKQDGFFKWSDDVFVDATTGTILRDPTVLSGQERELRTASPRPPDIDP